MEGESTRVPEGTSVIESSTPEVHSEIDAILAAQGLADVSETDLRGTESTENTANSEPTGDESNSNEDGTTQESKTEEITEEKEEPSETTKEEKTPKGFVPLAALHEVRGENKFLKEQIAKLTEAVSAKPAEESAKPEPSEFDNFKELTNAEFTKLVEETPSEALLYVNKLSEYKSYKQEQVVKAHEELAAQEYLNQVYSKASEVMEEAVPGIFDESSSASEEFKSFAVGLGFDETMFYLTNPATQVILPGDNTPGVLGEHAAQIIKVLAQARAIINNKASSDVNVDKIKADLRKEIETEVMSKVKAKPAFRSLNSVPDTGDARPQFADTVLSEAQFAKLNSKEQEIYLAGQ